MGTDFINSLASENVITSLSSSDIRISQKH